MWARCKNNASGGTKGTVCGVRNFVKSGSNRDPALLFARSCSFLPPQPSSRPGAAEPRFVKGVRRPMGLLNVTRIGRPAYLAAAALVLIFAGPAAAQTSIKFSLDGRLEGPEALVLLPQDKGYFKSEGLDVSVDDAASPVKAVFMVYNKPPYSIVARKNRGITEPKQLENKKLGAPSAGATFAQWPLFAKLNNIDVSKVTIENIGIPVRAPMLAAGQIDAALGFSFRLYVDLKDRGVPLDDIVLMPMADYGMKLYGNAIIVNSKFAAE